MKIYKLISQYIYTQDLTVDMNDVSYFSDIIGYYTDINAVNVALELLYDLSLDEAALGYSQSWLSYSIEIIEPNESFVGYYPKIFYGNVPVDGIFPTLYTENYDNFIGEDSPLFSIGDLVIYHPGDEFYGTTKIGIISKLPDTTEQYNLNTEIYHNDSYEVLIGIDFEPKVITKSYLTKLSIPQESLNELSLIHTKEKMVEYKKLDYLVRMLNSRLQCHLGR